MLSPFIAHLWADREPAARAEAAAMSRLVRDGAARYQGDPPPDVAAALRKFRATSGRCLVHYTIDSPTHRILEGLVGIAQLDRLVRHEETLPGPLAKPAALVEIRPVLAFTSAALPRMRPAGATAWVSDGTLLHTATPVRALEPVDAGPMIIADGHHRVRASREAGREGILTLLVGDDGKGLVAGAFQRRLTGCRLPPAFSGRFTTREWPRASAPRGGVVWVTGDGPPLRLDPEPAALDEMPEPLRAVPSAVVARLLDPLLAYDREATRYLATPEAASRDLGEGEAAVLMSGVPVSAVRHAAEAGCLLPPKGTRFRPKPVRGLAIRIV